MVFCGEGFGLGLAECFYDKSTGIATACTRKPLRGNDYLADGVDKYFNGLHATPPFLPPTWIVTLIEPSVSFCSNKV